VSPRRAIGRGEQSSPALEGEVQDPSGHSHSARTTSSPICSQQHGGRSARTLAAGAWGTDDGLLASSGATVSVQGISTIKRQATCSTVPRRAQLGGSRGRCLLIADDRCKPMPWGHGRGEAGALALQLPFSFARGGNWFLGDQPSAAPTDASPRAVVLLSSALCASVSSGSTSARTALTSQ
jgi:hypothetical protein